MTFSKDQIYASNIQNLKEFKFDESVANVFDDMINRSVPGYQMVTKMSGLVTSIFATEGSNLYDLGCSIGTSILEIQKQPLPRDCKIKAIDNSKAMLEKCQKAIANEKKLPAVEFECIDIEKVEIIDASIVLLNWTLQFIPTELREKIITNIFNGLLPGGVLLLSEKILIEDPILNRINIELHESFKKENGYSELEIARKRAALDSVLIPETLSTHRKRLLQSGFERCDIWFRYFNFASLIAIK